MVCGEEGSTNEIITNQIVLLEFCQRSKNVIHIHQTPLSLGRGSGFKIASFPGSRAWAEKKEPGTHCLRMLSSPRNSGYLETSVKSAPLH